MKYFYKTWWRKASSLAAGIIALVFTAYSHLLGAKDLPPAHLAIIHRSGETLVIDTLDSRAVLGTDNASGPNTIRSFMISWSDQLREGDEMGLLQRQNYFQYRMQMDWVALVGGDSIRPLLFRQKPLLDRHLRQGALVFSIRPGCRIDTLVCHGTEGFWTKEIINVKGK